MRCSILRRQVVVHAEVGLAGIPYGFLQLSVPLLANVVVLSAFATQRNLQGFRSRIVIIGAFPIEHDSVRTVLMNQKCPFERPQEGMVSAWRFVGACRFRFSEDDAGCRERFSEKRLCKLRNRLLVPLVFAGRNGRTGGDTAEGVLPPAITQPLLEAPDQHAHFHAPGAPVLMRFVQHDELPVLPPASIEQRTVVGTNQQILQHGVVGKQNVGRGIPHLLPKDELTRESSFRPPAALRRRSFSSSGVWPMYCPNVGRNADPASSRALQRAPRRSR